MKKQLIILFGSAVLGFTACNDSSNTTTPTNPGDTTVKTTTTTTTTTSVHPIANFEHRKFMSVKTGKAVILKIDTVNHYYMDATTNQQPDYYYFDPETHDTFDYRGRVLNNALIFNNGDYSIDESKLSDNGGSTSSSTMSTDTSTMTPPADGDTKTSSGNSKVKVKDDMYKEKTDNSKVKIKTK